MEFQNYNKVKSYPDSVGPDTPHWPHAVAKILCRINLNNA